MNQCSLSSFLNFNLTEVSQNDSRNFNDISYSLVDGVNFDSFIDNFMDNNFNSIDFSKDKINCNQDFVLEDINLNIEDIVNTNPKYTSFTSSIIEDLDKMNSCLSSDSLNNEINSVEETHFENDLCSNFEIEVIENSEPNDDLDSSEGNYFKSDKTNDNNNNNFLNNNINNSYICKTDNINNNNFLNNNINSSYIYKTDKLDLRITNLLNDIDNIYSDMNTIANNYEYINKDDKHDIITSNFLNNINYQINNEYIDNNNTISDNSHDLDNHILNQVKDKCGLFGSKHIKIQLHPSGLGSIGINIKIINGKVNLVFNVNNPIVEKTLLENIPELSNILNPSGVLQFDDIVIKRRKDDNFIKNKYTNNSNFKSDKYAIRKQ